VAEIISLDNKLQLSKHKKSELVKKRKLLAVRKVFQCTQCSYKCEKCGTQIPTEPADETADFFDPRIPYRFCESCSEEYLEYIDRLKGQGDPECYWHNSEWLDLWQKWIDYQGALDRYMKSEGFAKLLKELKQTHPDE
jgi:hypothetical protein